MEDNIRKAKGKSSEDYACRFLKRSGYKIICRNFTCKTGEIDIIVLDKKTTELVFVEVRFREYGIDAAIDSVAYTKRKRIFKAAAFFLLINQVFAEYNTRFDIIALTMDDKKRWQLEHIQDAFRNW
ncbi:MAG: YraN family protein [Candidatus Cloacimonetes bacterium]|nr:YraN family protein [Candidatus Cloacimonadota bacterium]